MTNEEFQAVMLKQMQVFTENFKFMHDQFGKIDQRFEQIDQRFEQIDQKFEKIDQRFEQINQKFETIDQRFDTLENNFAELKKDVGHIKGQQRENTDMIRALLHNQEVANAKLEALELNTATRESVEKLASKMNVLNQRLFNQEAEVDTLKNTLQLVK